MSIPFRLPLATAGVTGVTRHRARSTRAVPGGSRSPTPRSARRFLAPDPRLSDGRHGCFLCGMSETGQDRLLLLVRVAPEVAIKARRTRRRFQQRLTENLRDALRTAGCAASVRDRWGRLFVEAGDASAAGVIATVFGAAALSLVGGRRPATLDDLVRGGGGGDADRGRRRTVRGRAAPTRPE